MLTFEYLIWVIWKNNCRGTDQAVFNAYSWFCAHGALLAELGKPYLVLGNHSGTAACKKMPFIIYILVFFRSDKMYWNISSFHLQTSPFKITEDALTMDASVLNFKSSINLHRYLGTIIVAQWHKIA